MAASKPSRSEPSWITSWPMLVFLTAYSSCARNLRLRDSGLFYSSLLRRIRLQIFYRNRDGTSTLGAFGLLGFRLRRPVEAVGRLLNHILPPVGSFPASCS